MQNAKCRIIGEASLPIIDSVDVWFYLPSKAGGPRVSVVGGSRREHRASLNRRFNQ